MKKKYMPDIRWVLRTVYAKMLCPQCCCMCGALVNGAEPLCRRCGDTYFTSIITHRATEPQAFCNHCGRELISEQDICMACRTQAADSVYTQIISLFSYMRSGWKIVPLWKNKDTFSLTAVFARFIHTAIVNTKALQGISLVPVPPRPKKIKKRGWDQIIALTQCLHTYYGYSICNCLRRRESLPQKKLSKEERAVNLSGKIFCTQKSTLPEALIVIDDVMTTGATLRECGHVLKQHGCKKVYGLCLFFD